MLLLYLSSVAFQLVGLHYRLCYSISFIIALNEGVGLQLLGQNRFFTGFSYKLLKICFEGPLVRDPWSSVRCLEAPWLSVKGPGAPGRDLRAP